VRGMRKISRPKGERRFPDREDAVHLKAVRGQRCLLQGRRTTVTAWRGTHPHKEQVTYDAIHSCSGRIECHHVELKSQGGHDRDTLSLCSAGHRQLHDIGPVAFEKMWDVSLKVEAARLWALLKRESA
jgi:hypothetical protein